MSSVVAGSSVVVDGTDANWPTRGTVVLSSVAVDGAVDGPTVKKHVSVGVYGQIPV